MPGTLSVGLTTARVIQDHGCATCRSKRGTFGASIISGRADGYVVGRAGLEVRVGIASSRTMDRAVLI